VRHAVVLGLLLLGAYATAEAVQPSRERPPSPYCRGGDELAQVYHPSRLRLRSPCRIATGTVASVKFEEFDGDVHVDLDVDPAFRELLARGNERLHGRLVVEILPQDRSVVPVPAEGQRVTVVGPWVEDRTHGWSEIHPAWWISAGRIVPASPSELRRAEDLLNGTESGEDRG
jgi:hypothetical protein